MSEHIGWFLFAIFALGYMTLIGGWIVNAGLGREPPDKRPDEIGLVYLARVSVWFLAAFVIGGREMAGGLASSLVWLFTTEE